MTVTTGIRVGRYEVGRELGKGGFGILHVARDVELDREIAIKFLRPEHAFRRDTVQRFLQEARAAARIQHPGIVTVFESGVVEGTATRADGTVYIAMELLAGETLSARLRREGRFAPAAAIAIVRQLASALAAAHAAGIVHRDLTPHNVFLVPDAAVVGGERVKVVDFGIAKLVDGLGANVQTHSLVVLGTPMYMSPEQCKSSAKVDARSDIYALGCMLFELVCGRPPFEGDSGELIAKHQLVPPPEAREVAADVPAPLSKLIAEMLAKTPEERPQSMESVLDALDVCEGKGADATKTTALPASTRLGSRKLWLGAGGAIAIGVIAGVIATRGGSTRAPAPALVSDARIEPEAVHETPIAPLPAPPPAPPADATVAQAGGCDADDLKQKGLDLEASGLHAAALAEFEQALACKPEGRVAQYAFMAACNAGNLAKARQYYRDMTPDAQSRFLQMCIRRNITKDQLEGAEPAPALAPRPKPAATAAPPQPAPVATCDPEDLKQRGLDNESQGKHVPALAAFEAALACKPDPRVVQYAFMAACNAGNHAKAKVYYRKMTADARERFVQMCMRRDIPKDELEAP